MAALLEQAQQTDASQDEKYGKGCRGDELPAELARRESRLQKIGEAKDKAEQGAEAARKKIAERQRKEQETGKKAKGRAPKVPDPEVAVPEAKA